MLRKLYSILWMSLLFGVVAGCNEARQNSARKHTEKSDQYYRHFEGLLGQRACNFDLMVNGKSVFGTFYFSDYEQLEDVFGEMYSSDSLTLSQPLSAEFDSRLGAENFSQYAGSYKDGIFEGLFKQGDTVLPFRCSIVTKEVIPCGYKQIYDTVRDVKTGSPLVYQEFETPYTQRPQDEFLTSYLTSLISNNIEYKGDYSMYIQNVLKSDTQHVLNSDLNDVIAHPYTVSRYCDICYNKNSILIFSFTGMNFLGGMHESFSVKYCTIDMATKREMRIHDVLSEAEAKRLPALLEAKFRQKYKLTKEDKLSKVLFYDDNKFVNNNYYITQKGIGFQYDPHELAGFTKGVITLYLPFTEIRAN